jgi:AbrB family looped-hinge helix DNA binding protein
MKVGERGQITIPRDIRERYGLGPSVEVEIVEEAGRLLLRKAGLRECPIDRFVGILGENESTDRVLEETRGR